MLEQDYFANRLGDVYEYSRIPYKCGEGTSNQNVEYFWELCIDASGNIIFVLHTKEPLQSLANAFKIQSFSGISDDETWEIECTNLHFLAREAEISQKLPMFYLPNSITLKRKVQGTNHSTLAKAYFSNFRFSRVDCECGFLTKINGKELCFQMLENSKQLVEFIDIERISNAILSKISIPINQDEDIESIKDEATSISWFLNLLNLNTTFIPIIEYFSGSEIIQYSIENTVKNSFHRNYIIDNCRIDGGIPKAFNECYANYKSWQIKIDINTLIGFLVEINQQK